MVVRETIEQFWILISGVSSTLAVRMALIVCHDFATRETSRVNNFSQMSTIVECFNLKSNNSIIDRF